MSSAGIAHYIIAPGVAICLILTAWMFPRRRIPLWPNYAPILAGGLLLLYGVWTSRAATATIGLFFLLSGEWGYFRLVFTEEHKVRPTAWRDVLAWLALR